MRKVCVRHQGHLHKCPVLQKPGMKQSALSLKETTVASHHVYLQGTKIAAYSRIQCKIATDQFKERENGNLEAEEHGEGKKNRAKVDQISLCGLAFRVPLCITCLFLLFMNAMNFFLYEDKQRDHAPKFHNSHGV